MFLMNTGMVIFFVVAAVETAIKKSHTTDYEKAEVAQQISILRLEAEIGCEQGSTQKD
jgi:hypothetical protein